MKYNYYESAKPHLLFLTEMQIKRPADTAYLDYPGNILEHNFKPHAGVCVYVRYDICVRRLRDLEKTGLSTLWMLVDTGLEKILYAGVYRSHSGVRETSRLFQYLLMQQRYPYEKLVLLRDFNAHHKEWLFPHQNTDHARSETSQLSVTLNLTQLVQDATKMIPDVEIYTANSLDLLLTHDPDRYSVSVSSPLGDERSLHGELLYRRFVHSCYYDLERAKAAGDVFFSIRSSSPELFTDRDPLSPHMQKTFKITYLIKYHVPEKRYNIWIWQLNDPGLRRYDHLLDCKLFNLTTDAWLLDDDILEGEDIFISDAKDLSLKMVLRFSFSLAKKMIRYQQQGIPFRLKQAHIINAPSAIHGIMAFMKPFLRKEIWEIIHFHSPRSTTIYEYFSKEELPEEFGGTRGKLADYVASNMDDIMKKREYLIDDNLWRIDPNTIKKEKSEKIHDKTVENSTKQSGPCAL